MRNTRYLYKTQATPWRMLFHDSDTTLTDLAELAATLEFNRKPKQSWPLIVSIATSSAALLGTFHVDRTVAFHVEPLDGHLEQTVASFVKQLDSEDEEVSA